MNIFVWKWSKIAAQKKSFFFMFYPFLTSTQLVNLENLIFRRRWVLTHNFFVSHVCFVFVCLFSLSNKKYNLFNKMDFIIYKYYKHKTWLLNALVKIWPKKVNISWIRRKQVNSRSKWNYFPNQASSVRFL